MSKNKEPSDETSIPKIHRDDDLDAAGVSQVIIERFVKRRLPVLLKIDAEVNEGKKLTSGELELMERVVQRAHQINHFAYLYPENKEVIAKVISLFEDITSKALANESTPPEP